MSTSSLQLLPQHAGANLAPLNPLLKLGEGDKDASTYFDEALRERFLHFKDLEKATRDEMISAGEEVANFINGKQFLIPNPFKKGGWLPYQVKPGGSSPTERRALSMMQY